MDSFELLTSFNNTEKAFAYKSDVQLKKANFLFSLMRIGSLVKIGTRIMPLAIRLKLPVRALIKNTLFEQFVGGETLERADAVIGQLEKYNVDVILDYGVEGGALNENEKEAACLKFIEVIEHAGNNASVPFISIKVTGMVRFSLLEKMDAYMEQQAGHLLDRYLAVLKSMSEAEQAEWKLLIDRMDRICRKAAVCKVGVLMDAEETWIQDPIDALALLMMEQYNRERAIVYNTVQLYRHDRLKFLKDCHALAVEKKYVLGLKLVRGAYMEKERERAEKMGYPSPIQPNKQQCDRDFNAAVSFCVDHIYEIAIIVATHNEESNLRAIQLMREKGLPNDHPHVHLSQLFGMSDHITFNLADAGYGVSKYLPFGPLEKVVPYLMRRAQENTSVKGQTGRELELIRKERKRRGI